MRHRNVAYIILCFLLVIIFSYGCASRPREPEVTRFTIAFKKWVGYGLFYLAQEKGFCKEEGVELVFIDEQLDSARRDAFKQGMLDFEGGTIDLLISKAAQDTPIVAVMELDQSFGSDAIVADESIKKLEDLIGKKVALARDDVGETFISFLFYNKKLPLDSMTIVPKSSKNVAKAFLNNEADACVTWQPQVSEALQRPGAHILTSTREYQGIVVDTLNVRKDLVENNPKSVKALMRAWFKAVKYYRENPLEASEIIAKYYRITSEEYRKQAQGLKWIDYAEQKTPAKKQQWLNVFDTIAEIKFANARVTQKPDGHKLLNHTLLETLYEDSK